MKRLRHAWFGLFAITLAVASPHTSKALHLKAQDLDVLIGKSEQSFSANPNQTFSDIGGPRLQTEIAAYAALVEDYSFEVAATANKTTDPTARDVFELTGYFFNYGGRLLALEARAHHRLHKHSDNETFEATQFSNPTIRLSEPGSSAVIILLEASSARHILYRHAAPSADQKPRVEFYFSEEQKQIVEMSAMSQDPLRDLMAEYVELVKKHGFVDPTQMMSVVSFANSVHYAEYLQFHAIRTALINRWALSRMVPFEIKERPIQACGKTFLFFNPTQVSNKTSPYLAELNQISAYQEYTSKITDISNSLGSPRFAPDTVYGEWFAVGIGAAGYDAATVANYSTLKAKLETGPAIHEDLMKAWNGDTASTIVAGKEFVPRRTVFPGDSFAPKSVASRMAKAIANYFALQAQFSVADKLMNGNGLAAHVRGKIIAAVANAQKKGTAVANFQKAIEAQLLAYLEKQQALENSSFTRAIRLDKRVRDLLPKLVELAPYAAERAKQRNRNKLKIGWDGGKGGGKVIAITDSATLKLFYDAKVSYFHSGRKFHTIVESASRTAGNPMIFGSSAGGYTNQSVDVGHEEEMRELLMNDPDVRKVMDTFFKGVEKQYSALAPRQSADYSKEFATRTADYESYVSAKAEYEKKLKAYRAKYGNLDPDTTVTKLGITVAQALGKPLEVKKPMPAMKANPELLATIVSRFAGGLRAQYPTTGKDGGTLFNQTIEYALSKVLNIPNPDPKKYPDFKLKNEAFIRTNEDRMLLAELKIAQGEQISSLLSVRWSPEQKHFDMYDAAALSLLGAEAAGPFSKTFFTTKHDKFGVERIAKTDEITLVEHIGLAGVDHKTGKPDKNKIYELIRAALVHAGHSSTGVLEDFCEADPTHYSKDEKFAELFKSSTKARLILGSGASLLNPSQAPNLPFQTKLNEKERLALENFKTIDLTKYEASSNLTKAKKEILRPLHEMLVPETEAYDYGFSPVALTTEQLAALAWVKTDNLKDLIKDPKSPLTAEQIRALAILQSLKLSQPKMQTEPGANYDKQLLAIATLQRGDFVHLPKGTAIPYLAQRNLRQIQSIKLPSKQGKLSSGGKTVVSFSGEEKASLAWIQTDTFRNLYKWGGLFTESEQKILSTLRDIDLSKSHLTEIQAMDAQMEKDVRTPVEAFTEDYIDPVMTAVMYIGIFMALFWVGGFFSPAIGGLLVQILGATTVVALNTAITAAIVVNFFAIAHVSLIEHPPHYRYQAQVGNTQAGNTIDGAAVQDLMLWNVWQSKKDLDKQKIVVQTIMLPLNIWMVSSTTKMLMSLRAAGKPLTEAQIQALMDSELLKMAEQHSPTMNLPQAPSKFKIVTAAPKVEPVIVKPVVLVENTIGANASTRLQALRADLINELRDVQTFAEFQKNMPRYVDSSLQAVERDLIYFEKLGDLKNWNNGYLTSKEAPTGLLPRSASDALASGQITNWARQSGPELAPHFARAAEDARALVDALKKLRTHLSQTLTGETQMNRAELTINVMADDELLALRALFAREGSLVYQVPSLSGTAEDKFNMFLEQMMRTTERSSAILPGLKVPANQTFKAYWGQPYNSLEGLTNDQRRYAEWLSGYLPQVSGF